jgi:hypothetical protein
VPLPSQESELSYMFVLQPVQVSSLPFSTILRFDFGIVPTV